MKRWISAFLCIAMLLSMCGELLMPAAAAELPANNQQQIEAYINNPPAGVTKVNDYTVTNGNVTISKQITPTDKENYFDITLTVDDKETVQEKGTDIVIVMDVSNTMNSDHNGVNTSVETEKRLYDAKQAAKYFVEEYATREGLSSERNLGIVVFNTDAKIVFGSGGLKNVKNITNQTDAKNTIDGITAPDGIHERYTNIQGGLLLAKDMLSKGDSNNYKYIILITDGFPTTYTNESQSNTTQKTGYSPRYSGGKPAVGTDGAFWDFVSNKACKYGTSYSDTAANKAQTVAQQIKAAGYNIFSIGVDVNNSSQTIQKYINQTANQTSDYHSVVERTSETYVIGGAADSDAYRNWLKTSIGGGPALPNGGYATGDSLAELKTAFNQLLTTVANSTVRSTLNPEVVSDPMGEHINFLGFYNKNNKLSGNKLSGSYNLGAENSASFTSEITWNVAESGYTKKTVNNTTYYSYQLKYRVRLENELSSFQENKIYQTNDDTLLKYKDPETGAEKTLTFPVPQVEGYLGEFSFKKVDETTNAPLSNVEFTLTHKSNCSVCGGTVNIPAVTDTSGSDGMIQFTRIPSGHAYELKETKAAPGYQLDTTKYAIGVHYNTVYWNNGSVPATVSNKRLASISVSLKGSKTMNDNTPEDGKFQFALYKGTLDKDNKDLIVFTEQVGNAVSNDASGNFTFPDLSFDSVGTYYYEIRELADANDRSVIYDKTLYHVEVTIGLNEDNTAFTKNVVYKNHTTGGNTVSSAAFANTSRGPAVVVLNAKKVLSNRLIGTGEFSFTLTGNGVSQTKTNDEQGNVTFDPLTFTAPGGPYTYEIKEVLPATPEPYMHYDKGVCTVTVNISTPDEGDGPYVASVVYEKDGAEGNTFTNMLVDEGSGDLVFKKVNSSNNPLGGVKFTLTHNHTNCSVSIGEKEATSDSSGTVSFTGIPSGHYYTLTEEDNPTIDDVTYQTAAPREVAILYGKAYINGVLSTSENPVSIVNVPTKEARVILKAYKNFDDKPAGADLNGQFSFTLSGKSIPETQVNMSNGTVSEIAFDPIVYKQTGTYHYTITENYDATTADPSIHYDETTYYVTVVVGVDPTSVTETEPLMVFSTPQNSPLNGTNSPEDGNESSEDTSSNSSPSEDTSDDSSSSEDTSEDTSDESSSEDTSNDSSSEDTSNESSSSEDTSGDSASSEDTSSDSASSEDTSSVSSSSEDSSDDSSSEDTSDDFSSEDTSDEDGESELQMAIRIVNSGIRSSASDIPEIQSESDDDTAKTGGKLVATVYYTTGNYYGHEGAEVIASEQEVVFKNTTRTGTSVQLNATKQLADKVDIPLADNEFTFALLDANRNEIQRATNDSNGAVNFTSISYNAVGTHTYYIREIQGIDTLTTYDNTEYKVTVTITAPRTSTSYKASVVYEKITIDGNKPVEKAVFTNNRLTTLALKKTDATHQFLAGAHFSLIHSCSGCSADIPDITAVSRVVQNTPESNLDESRAVMDANVLFIGIPIGHTYILRETQAPDGYVPAPDHLVKIVQGQAEIYEKDGEGWNTTPEDTDSGVHSMINYPKAKVTLSGVKQLLGHMMEDKEFTFQLLASDKTTVLQETTNDANGQFTFDPIEYSYIDGTQEGTDHVYYVREVIPEGGNQNGITYDTRVYQVTVTVKVTEEHEVTAKVSYDLVPSDESSAQTDTSSAQAVHGILFSNVYRITGDVTVSLKGTKALTGRTLQKEEFFFAIYAAVLDENNTYVATGEPLQTATNDENGNILFKPRTFNTLGTFHYIVKEINNGLGGVTYDSQEHHICIRIEDNQVGGYKAIVTDTNGTELTPSKETGENGVEINHFNAFAFSNAYNYSGNAYYTIRGLKQLEGRTLKANEFSFALYAQDSNEPLETVTNNADGSFSFSSLSFDTPGTYIYTVKEVPGELAGIRYDPEAFTVTITVIDNLAGGLNASATFASTSGPIEVTPEGDAGVIPIIPVTFSNTFTTGTQANITLRAKKTLEGRPLTDQEFTFRLYETGSNFAVGTGAAPLDTAKNDVNGNIVFDTITYDQAGNYYYVIREDAGNAAGMTYDPAEYHVTVAVSKDPNSSNVVKLVASAPIVTNASGNSADPIFRNIYKHPDPIHVPVSVTKIVKNVGFSKISPKGFQFMLKDIDNGSKLTATSDRSGKASFDLEYGYSDAGKTFTYQITEIDTERPHVLYSNASYDLTVSIRLDSTTNTLHADVTLDKKPVEDAEVSFKNYYFAPILSNPGTGDDSQIATFALILTLSISALAAFGLFWFLKRRKS